jgi:hypothetical protein
MDLISRTIGGIVDQKFSLHNDFIARTMSIGTSWTRLRLGMRMALTLNGLATTFTPKFYFGLCSGTSSVVGDQTPTNFFGFAFRQGVTWNPSGNSVAQLGGSIIAPTKVVNGVETVGTSAGSFFASTVLTVRNIIVLEVTKGSPNYTFGFLHPNSQAGAETDTLLTDLTNTITATTMSIGNYANESVAMAFDEVAGGLDSANIYWNLDSRYIEVSELLWVKMA